MIANPDFMRRLPWVGELNAEDIRYGPVRKVRSRTRSTPTKRRGEEGMRELQQELRELLAKHGHLSSGDDKPEGIEVTLNLYGRKDYETDVRIKWSDEVS